MYTIHFLTEGQEISDEGRGIIEGVVRAVYERVHRMLDLPECDVFFSLSKKRVFAGEVFGESLNDESSCYVFVDWEAFLRGVSDDPDGVARNFAEHLYAGLYATARIRRTGVGSDCGLLEEIVGEGLAGHFMSEMGDGTAKGYYISLSPEEYSRFRGQMLEECAGGSGAVEKWFVGSDGEGIPKFAALSVGFGIVAEYLEKTGKSSTDVLSLSAEEFVK